MQGTRRGLPENRPKCNVTLEFSAKKKEIRLRGREGESDVVSNPWSDGDDRFRYQKKAVVRSRFER